MSGLKETYNKLLIQLDKRVNKFIKESEYFRSQVDITFDLHDKDNDGLLDIKEVADAVESLFDKAQGVMKEYGISYYLCYNKFNCLFYSFNFFICL